MGYPFAPHHSRTIGPRRVSPYPAAAITRQKQCKPQSESSPVNIVQDLAASSIKENMVFRPVLPQDEWKVSFVKELIMIRSHDMMIENVENIELDEILDYLCTS